ncbi:VOC family protein [Virgibacillus salinus]|uniref:Lactoylglutathione lyase n=1 Tax=Virgibacillus salinus TaxID=553311 RepID=A0A1H1DMX3_9BACI|nr:VOC family protein [Virgibacillus salinus]SDQ77236.1 lactoylglutathione lyase [Virgibacillus salinus]
MNFKEFGTILFVEQYEACINFYKNVLQLNVNFEKADLVSFNVSDGYLMVERGGFSSEIEKSRQQNPVVLRFDVNDVDEEVSILEKHGVAFLNKRLEFDWGIIAVFLDPDGNRIELGQIKER